MSPPGSRAWRLLVTLGVTAVISMAASAPAQAAIGFIAASPGANGSGATTLSISKPTGTAEGQVMVAVITAAGTGSITTPSGWTAVKTLTQGSTVQGSYYRVAGASEPTSYSWSLGSNRAASGGIVTYSGVNPTVPVDATAGASGASGNATASSVTTSANGDQVLVAASFGAVTTVTPGTSTTERFDTSSGSNTSELADFNQSTAGTTSSKTVAPSVTTGVWLAQTIALRDTTQATLSLSTTAAPTFSANLNSGDQSQTFTVPLSLNDSRTGASAGLGWNTTITSTQFTTGTRTLASNSSTITGVTSSCANGGICTEPTNSITYPVAVPAAATAPAAVKFYSAASTTGKGLFTLTPTVSVTVPQNSFAGTYSSTLTIAVVSGP